MFSFAIDIHRNILSAQCFIRCKTSNGVDKMHIAVQSNFLEICFYSGVKVLHELKLFYPSNFFIPTTFCSSENAASVYTTGENEECQVKSEYKINQSNSELSSLESSFRLQISNDRLIDETLLKPNGVMSCKSLLKTLIKPKTPYRIVCSRCNNILNEVSVEFNSIEDFHFDNSELSESWFCHTHIATEPEVMRSDNCYVSEIFVYLHESVVDLLNMEKDGKYYKCNSCNIILSSKVFQTFVPFFCDAMVFKTTDQSNNQELCSIATFTAFQSLIEHSLQSSVSCKVYLCCKTTDGEKCILLWITAQKVVQCLLHFELKGMPKEMHLKTKEVYKVLYCVPAFNSEIEKSWKHDCFVDYNNISENMFTFIIGLLKTSSKYFPEIENVHENFKIGYLPAYNFDT